MKLHVREFIGATIGLFLASTLMVAQSFDVASVRPGQPGARGHLSAENGRLAAEGFTLPGYIIFAWNLALTREQLDAMAAHLPKWVSTDSFDIQAKTEGNPTQDQMRLMLRSLLADRFKLVVHFETTQAPGARADPRKARQDRTEASPTFRRPRVRRPKR